MGRFRLRHEYNLWAEVSTSAFGNLTAIMAKARRDARQRPFDRRNTSGALVPPKPNEFDNTVLISRLRGVWGTRSIDVSTEGLSRLIVGGTIWSRIASTEKIASAAPAAPRRWPVADFVEDIEMRPAALPTTRCTAFNSISSPIGVEVPWALM